MMDGISTDAIRFIVYTMGVFLIGFCAGAVSELLRSKKQHENTHKKYMKSYDELAKLHEAQLKKLEQRYEELLAMYNSHFDRGHDSSEFVPNYTA